MFVFKFGILIVLCSACQSISIFPEGNKWEYDYEGVVITGTHVPNNAETGWTIFGKLLITSFSNKIVMQLTDVKSSYYNGPAEEAKGKNDALDDDAKYIEKPFLVQYNEGNVEDISVSPEDPLWSVNIKRGIVSVFQLDLKKIRETTTYIDETNIYGDCKNIEYSSTNMSDGTLEVIKVINFDSCQQTSLTYKTTQDFFCKPESIMTASAGRKYIVDLDSAKDGAIIKEVGSISERLVQPFNARYGAYRLLSRQKFNLKQTSKAEKITVPDNLTRKTDLKFEQTTDFTQERKNFDQDEAIRVIKYQSADVADSLEDEITKNPAILHNNTINTIYWIMVNLDETHFEKLYADIAIGTSYQDETRKNLVLEILPQIGSHASVNFIKKLVLNRKLNNLSALKILAQYPFYVKQLSEKLLSELEVFLDLNPNFDDKIKNTAVLSFATLIYKTYSSGLCSEETFEKYVLKYFTLFTDSTTHEGRMVYLHGLRNLQLGSVVDFLTPVVKNKTNSHHIRFLAVWAFMAIAHTRPAQMFNLYWPILMDRTEHLEMRVAALTMLIISQPTSSRLMSLYWYMKTEPSAQLNNYFYSTLNSLQYTTYPCYLHLGKIASKIVRYVNTPTTLYKKFTENVVLDYMNAEGGFGSMYQLFLVGNDNEYVPNIMYLTMSKTGNGQILQQIALYLKVVGVKDFYYPEKLKMNARYGSVMDGFLNILKNQKLKIYTPEPFHFEFLLQIQDKTVFCKYFDLQTIKEVSKILRLLDDSHFNHQFTVPPTTMDHFATTDLGTVAYFGFMRNTLSSLRSNFTSDNKKGLLNAATDLNFRFMEYMEKRLDVFNPIRNVYHGLVKLKTVQADLSYNTTAKIVGKFERVVNKWDLSNGRSGVTMHGEMLSYIANMDDLLYNQHSPLFSIKTVNPTNCKKQDRQMDFPVKGLGIKFVFTVFDCANFGSYKRLLTNSFADLLQFQHNTKNDKYGLKLILYVTHLLDKINYYAPPESCGISLQVLPYYEDSTVMKLEMLLDNDVFIGVHGILYNEIDPSQINQWWNASIGLLEGNNKFVYKFIYGDGNEKINALCVDFELNKGLKTPKLPELKYTSLKPVDKSIMDINVAWGIAKEADQCPDVPSINFRLISSISDEQKNAAKSSTNWPFKQCKKRLGSRNFNPASPECFLSAEEMSTYRDYDNEIVFKQVPGWIQKGVDKVYENLQYRNSKINAPKFNNGDAQVKFNLHFPMEERNIVFTSSENEKATLDHTMPKKLLQNPKLTPELPLSDMVPVYDDYGTCIISQDFVRTQKNVSVTNFNSKNKYIALTQCTKIPEFMSYVSFAKEGIYLTINSLIENIEIIPKSGEIVILVDGKTWNKEQEFEGLTIKKNADIYEIKCEHSRLEVAYSKDFVILIGDMYHTCGICNPGGEETDKFIFANPIET